MSEMMDCIWQGLKLTAVMVGWGVVIILSLIFITWGFADDPNFWFVGGRLTLMIFVMITSGICAEKRWPSK